MQSLCRFTLAVPLLSTLLASAPARAGRASACKAPPFAVPKETQRAVDAAIDARVTGAGAGGASSTVAVRTDYETTTLSQDAVARAWFEFTICNKLAKKLISQELHDELLRGLLAPQLIPPPTAVDGVQASSASTETVPSPPQALPATPSAEQIVGTWNVVSHFDTGSCPAGISGGNSAYIWLVSLKPDGTVAVQVQGQTSYDVLEGAFSEGHLRVGAPVNAAGAPNPKVIASTAEGTQIAVLARSDYDLHVEGDELIGDRVAAIWGSTLSEEDGMLTILPCMLHYTVKGTR